MGYKCSLRASVTNGEEQRHLEIKSVMMAIRKSSDGALDRVDLYRVRRVRQSLYVYCSRGPRRVRFNHYLTILFPLCVSKSTSGFIGLIKHYE